MICETCSELVKIDIISDITVNMLSLGQCPLKIHLEPPTVNWTHD